jgi:hypothetical protein
MIERLEEQENCRIWSIILVHDFSDFVYIWIKMAHTQMTRFSWPFGLVVSMGVRPVMSSRRTTPNEYTSVLSFTLPYMKYSGAKYLL